MFKLWTWLCDKSLASVGGISLVGAVTHALKRQVGWRSVGWFGISGGVGTYLGAALNVSLSCAAQLLLFTVVMLLAAALMFRPANIQPEGTAARSPWKTRLEGLGVGVGDPLSQDPDETVAGKRPCSRKPGVSG